MRNLSKAVLVSSVLAIQVLASNASAQSYKSMNTHPYSCHFLDSNGQIAATYVDVNTQRVFQKSGSQELIECPMVTEGHWVTGAPNPPVNSGNYYIAGKGLSGCSVCYGTHCYPMNSKTGSTYSYYLLNMSAENDTSIQCWVPSGPAYGYVSSIWLEETINN
jgi:hypothetical protein